MNEESNKIISKFDGWRFMKLCGLDGEEKNIPLFQKFDDDGECIHPGIFDQPDYSDNWNLLIPVWVKFRTLQYDYPNGVKREDLKKEHKDFKELILGSLELGYKKLCFESLVNAIKWHNKNIECQKKL